VRDGSVQAAHYHIFGLKVFDFIRKPALGWLPSKEVG
jgi:hypothetical protein